MCIKSSPFKGRGRGGVCIVITHHCFRFLEKFAAKIQKRFDLLSLFSLFFVMVLQKGGFSLGLDRLLTLMNANYLPFHCL